MTEQEVARSCPASSGSSSSAAAASSSSALRRRFLTAGTGAPTAPAGRRGLMDSRLPRPRLLLGRDPHGRVSGPPPDEVRKVYAAVDGAQRAASPRSGPGPFPEEVDRAARKVIEDAEAGRFLHAPPRARPRHGRARSPVLVRETGPARRAANVCTIEPSGSTLPGPFRHPDRGRRGRDGRRPRAFSRPGLRSSSSSRPGRPSGRPARASRLVERPEGVPLKKLAVLALLLATPLLGRPPGQDAGAPAGGGSQRPPSRAGASGAWNRPFEALPGVSPRFTSGYTGGRKQNPNVRGGVGRGTDTSSPVQVLYDPRGSPTRGSSRSSGQHRPTDGSGQFLRPGIEYRPVLSSTRGAAPAGRGVEGGAGISKPFKAPVVVEIAPGRRLWPAEEYHQQYHRKNRFVTSTTGAAAAGTPAWQTVGTAKIGLAFEPAGD